MSELEILKRKRATVRTLTTKQINAMEQELKNDECNMGNVEVMLSLLLEKELSLKELNKQVESLIKDVEEIEKEVESSEEYQDKICSIKFRVNRRLNKKKDGNRENNSESSGCKSKPSVHLPSLTISKFKGNPLEWQSFWDQFCSAVHENEILSNAEKFNYLKSYLEGNAKDVISGFSMSNENYEQAVEILKGRYGRKDIINNALMNKLLTLQAVKKLSDLEGLRKLYDECEVNIRSLNALGTKSESYGALLCPLLLKLMPEELALEFSRRRTEDQMWDVKGILEFLKGEVEGRERALFLTRSGSSDSTVSKPNTEKQKFNKNSNWKENKQNKEHLGSAAALATGATYKCLFCDKINNHSTESCSTLSLKQKKDRLRLQRRCFICLGKNHMARYCKAKTTPCTECGIRHHISLCEGKKGNEPETKHDTGDAVMTSVSPCNVNKNNNTVLLQTVEAVATGAKRNMTLRCLLDGGSQRTFVRKDISEALSLPVIGEERLNIHTFGTKEPKLATLKRVKLCLINKRDKDCSMEIEALETPHICSPLMNIADEDLRQEIKMKGFELSDTKQADTEDINQISVLIGADCYWEVVTGRIQRLSKGRLVGIETIFGWCLQGPVAVTDMSLAQNSVAIMKVMTTEEQLVSENLRSFWELESLGIKDSTPELTFSDKRAIDSFESTIQLKDGRYEVSLPWNEEQGKLANNFYVAKKRLNGLIHRLRKDVVLYENYNAVIQEQINENIVEIVSEEIRGSEQMSDCYYMPHQPVVKPDRNTTKLRIVFDASAHDKGCLSLNECLLSGPNLNPDLLSLLLKFRKNKIAFTADIQRAFLQISLMEEDRNFVRFLWVKDPFAEMEDSNILVLRMTRVLFGATSSPFLLAATVRHHAKKYADIYPKAYETISDSLYVDDLISGADSVEQARKITTETKEILGTAGFELRKWQTNSEELNEIWERDPNFETEREGIHEIKTSPLKVLGLTWKSQTDELTFEISGLLKFLIGRENTKRFVLQAASRIFDPLGFISPFTIRVKILFQELWERGLEWDEELPTEIEEIWKEWCIELPNLKIVSVPRFYFCNISQSELNQIQVHVFCDASPKAYGAVAYIRYELQNKCGVSFITSKSRVAPLKRLTLPRLELMGALLGARLANFVKGVLGIKEGNIYLWSDSTITLHWIRGSSRNWKPFVANRISEIHGLTDPQQWQHCKGRENPADLLTRGSHIVELQNDGNWWFGPDWLQLQEENWPAKFPVKETLENKEELEMEKLQCSALQVTCRDDQKHEIIDMNKFSSLARVLRVTAWVLRFVNNVNKKSTKQTGELTPEELVQSEKVCIKLVQANEYSQELTYLRNKKPVNRESKIHDLDPFLDDDNLICVGGRLQKSEFSFRECHPWILPNKCRLAELQVQESHNRLHHCGLRDTLVQVREKFWIPRGRQLVKKVIGKCIVCKILKARPGTEKFAPLPSDRIKESPPFEITGIDFAGPLYVKVKNGSEKAYIALFTCAVTRAVHLELVTNLTTEYFMLALKRFFARRGISRVIYTDNAKTFKGAEKMLKGIWKTLENLKHRSYFGLSGIQWKYIVERAAFWGGFWERMVRSVKTCLKKSLGKALLTYEEMETVLIDIEAVLNSRPISYTYNDAAEPSPLTPSHFLIGKRLTSLPSWKTCNNPVSNVTRDQLTKRVKYRESLIDRFWGQWRKDYILQLKSAHSLGKLTSNSVFKERDVVLICEDKLPRHMWRMGLIDETFVGRDGRVRSCSVKLATGKIIKRPIQLLCPLEI